MSRVNLLCAKSCECFIPFIQNFSFILKKHNIPHTVNFSYDPAQDTQDQLWIAIWMSLVVLPKKCIVLNYDPAVPWVATAFKGLLERSKSLNDSKILTFYDYTTSEANRSEFLKILNPYNIPYAVTYYGASPFYENLHSKLSSNSSGSQIYKDIDVLMYGNLVGRRVPMIRRLIEFCNNNGYKICLRQNNLYGADKIQMIQRAKIVLSYASADTKQFLAHDLARISELICTKNFVLVEYIGDDAVEKIMDKYVAFYGTIEEMFEKIKYYLEHFEERQKRIDGAYERFPKDFSLEKDLLDIIKEHN